MVMDYKKLWLGIIVIGYAFLGSSLPAHELAVRATSAFSRKPHTFTTITQYAAVHSKVLELSKSANVSVLTDWDDTINAPGAWRQKKYDGSWVCSHSKRMLLEHEVDTLLRDQETPEIIQSWKRHKIPVLVTTARPPVIDVKLKKYALQLKMHSDLMNIRLPHADEEIDYLTINQHISSILNTFNSEKLKSKTEKKVNAMIAWSGINLKDQPNLDYSVIKTFGQHLLAYHNGYAFIGHNKGAHMLQLLQEVQLSPGHLVIVDDSPRAIGSYLEAEVIKGFEELGYTLHLMHYPI